MTNMNLHRLDQADKSIQHALKLLDRICETEHPESELIVLRNALQKWYDDPEGDLDTVSFGFFAEMTISEEMQDPYPAR